LRPNDFNRLLKEIQKGSPKRAGRSKQGLGLVRLGNEITRVKSVFKFALENGLIDKPMLFGTEFKKPEESEIRGERQANGKKQSLTPDEIHRLLDAADVQMRAMLLVAVNAAMGNNDVATLPIDALDLDGGWITYPRPKTKIDRRCPLWPETVRALRAWLAVRPEPEQESAKGCVFVTARGRQWLSDVTAKFKDESEVEQRIAYPVVAAFSALAKRVGVHRKGVGFYVFRHVFRAQADGALDGVAIDRIMGHKDPTMGGHYRDTGSGIDDSRLIAVAQRVHDWLFPKPVDAPSDEPAKPKRQSRKPKAKPVEPASDGPALRLFIA
jgi:integrase